MNNYDCQILEMANLHISSLLRTQCGFDNKLYLMRSKLSLETIDIILFRLSSFHCCEYNLCRSIDIAQADISKTSDTSLHRGLIYKLHGLVPDFQVP